MIRAKVSSIPEPVADLNSRKFHQKEPLAETEKLMINVVLVVHSLGDEPAEDFDDGAGTTDDVFDDITPDDSENDTCGPVDGEDEVV